MNHLADTLELPLKGVRPREVIEWIADEGKHMVARLTCRDLSHVRSWRVEGISGTLGTLCALHLAGDLDLGDYPEEDGDWTHGSRLLRAFHGSARDLAEAIGVHPDTVRGWAHDDRVPDSHGAARLLRACCDLVGIDEATPSGALAPAPPVYQRPLRAGEVPETPEEARSVSVLVEALGISRSTPANRARSGLDGWRRRPAPDGNGYVYWREPVDLPEPDTTIAPPSPSDTDEEGDAWALLEDARAELLETRQKLRAACAERDDARAALECKGRTLERTQEALAQATRAQEGRQDVEGEALRQMRVERDEAKRRHAACQRALAAQHKALRAKREECQEARAQQVRAQLERNEAREEVATQRIQIERLERERAEQGDEIEKLREEMIRAEEVAQTWRAGLTEARAQLDEVEKLAQALLQVLDDVRDDLRGERDWSPVASVVMRAAHEKL